MKCGWASSSEYGTINGKPGDQTGREVRTGELYFFGQTQCMRWKDRKLADTFAKTIEYMCNDPQYGYGQKDRRSSFEALKDLDWDYTKLKKKVNTDCSELTVIGVNCTLGKEVIKSWVYTGNLATYLIKSGYFEYLTDDKYVAKSYGGAYNLTGDILIAPGHHVIIVLEDGSKAKAPKKTPKKTKVTIPTYKAGNIYTLQYEMSVRTGPSVGYRKKKYSELTADGKKHDKDGDGALDKGTKVTCKDIHKNADGSIWMKTPSGWISAYDGDGTVFIK